MTLWFAAMVGALTGLFVCVSWLGPLRVTTLFAPADRAAAASLHGERDNREGRAAAPASITLACVGDVLPVNVADPFEHVSRALRSADIAFCNLECPLSMRGSPTPHKFHAGNLIPNEYIFRGSPRAAKVFAENRIGVVSLANNHTMDYGRQGLEDTLALLDRNGIRHAGAGLSGDAAQRAVVIKRHGLRVAFLAFVAADLLPSAEHFAASDHEAGLALVRGDEKGNPDGATVQRLAEDIAAAHRAAEVVVVSFHWGRELCARPTRLQRQLAHLAIDQGANLVVGHHPHCVQGIEKYKGKPILYSLGNFVFPARSDLTQRGMIARLTLGARGVRNIAIQSVSIRGSRPTLSDGAEAKRTVSAICTLSHELGAHVLPGRLSGHPAACVRIADSATPRQVRTPGVFVDVQNAVPGVALDLRYATSRNAFHTRLYRSSRGFLRRGTAMKLKHAEEILRPSGFRLKVWDAYRPLSVQRLMWQNVRDRRYVAGPRTGSAHNRGAAVDVTLVDEYGNELLMPTGFDVFTSRAHAESKDASQEARSNCALLRHVMISAGFVPLATEWWHFEDRDARRYPLADTPVEQLASHGIVTHGA